MRKLQHHFSKTKNQNLNDDDLKVVAEYIISPEAKSLKQLWLWQNLKIGDKGGEEICRALLASKYCKLETLNLTETGIGINTVKLLREYLLSPASSHFTQLFIDGSDIIDDNAVEILCSALQYNSTLTYLDLSFCELVRERGAMMIENLLTNYKSSLSHIYLDHVDENIIERLKILAANNNRYNIFCDQIDSPPLPSLLLSSSSSEIVLLSTRFSDNQLHNI